MLDHDAAFRYGFLLKCAAAGVPPPHAAALLRKVAESEFYGTIKGLAGDASNFLRGGAGLAGYVAQKGLMLPAGLGLGAAAGMGAAGGLTLAHLREGTTDPEEVRKQELIAAYNTFADQVRRRRQLRPPSVTGYRGHL